MKYMSCLLLMGLFACDVDKLEVFSIPLYKEFKVFEHTGARELGGLRFKPNNTFTLTKNVQEWLPNQVGLVNVELTILGIYTAEGNNYCFKNQMISRVKLYNRWGEELRTTEDDLNLIRSKLENQESYAAVLDQGRFIIK